MGNLNIGLSVTLSDYHRIQRMIERFERQIKKLFKLLRNRPDYRVCGNCIEWNQSIDSCNIREKACADETCESYNSTCKVDVKWCNDPYRYNYPPERKACPKWQFNREED